jgi:hypothetical protein
MKLKEEISDFVYLGKRIDKALKYVKTNKPDLIKWFKEYVETPYQDIMSGGLELEEEDYIFDYLDSLLDDLEKQFNIILEKQTKMNKETLRMQMLSGIITEGEYKQKLEENKTSKTNESLNENFVGMEMVGNIFDREKTDYEIAFEHFSKGKMNEEIDEEQAETEESFEDVPLDKEMKEIKEVASDDVYDDIASELGLTDDEFDEALNNSMAELDIIERIYFSNSYTRREKMSIIADLLKL